MDLNEQNHVQSKRCAAIFMPIALLCIISVLSVIGCSNGKSKTASTARDNFPVEKSNYSNPPAPVPTNKITKRAEPVKQEKSTAYKMASLDAGYYIKDDDIKVHRFAYLLSELEQKTGLTQDEISDITYVAWDTIARKKYGLEITLLDLLEGINDTIPNGSQAVTTKDGLSIVAVTYIDMRK